MEGIKWKELLQEQLKEVKLIKPSDDRVLTYQGIHVLLASVKIAKNKSKSKVGDQLIECIIDSKMYSWRDFIDAYKEADIHDRIKENMTKQVNSPEKQ